MSEWQCLLVTRAEAYLKHAGRKYSSGLSDSSLTPRGRVSKCCGQLSLGASQRHFRKATVRRFSMVTTRKSVGEKNKLLALGSTVVSHVGEADVSFVAVLGSCQVQLPCEVNGGKCTT